MVAVIVADPDEKNAGFRQRIGILYGGEGVGAEILSCRDMQDPKIFNIAVKKHETFILVKPFDEMYWVLAHILICCGKKIICDVFDNYFQYNIDTLRRGIGKFQIDVLELAAAVIVSTEVLRSQIQKVVSNPEKVVAISDPLSPTRQTNWRTVNLKWERAIAARRLNVLWFGIASNPHFASGLVDIALIMPFLKQITGYDIEITICTNINDDIDLLSGIYKHPYPIRLEPWSLESQERCLQEAHVVILPTNASPFVLSKTHNRYSTAIQEGALVLHTGHPEYKGDNREVLDLLADPCPMNAYNIVEYLRDAGASLNARYRWDRLWWRVEAVLERVQSAKAGPNRRLCILWAPKPGAMAAHKLASRHGLTAGVQVADQSFNYHLTFTTTQDDELALFIRDEKKIPFCDKSSLIEIGDGMYRISSSDVGISPTRISFLASQVRLGIYSRDFFDDLEAILRRVVGGTACIARGFSFATSDKYALSMAIA